MHTLAAGIPANRAVVAVEWQYRQSISSSRTCNGWENEIGWTGVKPASLPGARHGTIRTQASPDTATEATSANKTVRRGNGFPRHVTTLHRSGIAGFVPR